MYPCAVRVRGTFYLYSQKNEFNTRTNDQSSNSGVHFPSFHYTHDTHILVQVPLWSCERISQTRVCACSRSSAWCRRSTALSRTSATAPAWYDFYGVFFARFHVPHHSSVILCMYVYCLESRLSTVYSYCILAFLNSSLSPAFMRGDTYSVQCTSSTVRYAYIVHALV